MTTEQKEAIEKLQQKLNPKEFGGYCVLGYNQKYCFGKSEVEAIETVLNLVQEQEKEIEHWKNGFERELESNRENACELLKQDLIIRKKDKIIDLMAKAFKQDDVRSVEEIKQYFERESRR